MMNHQKQVFLRIMAVLVWMGGTCLSQEFSKPSLLPGAAGDNIRIDGRLIEAAWSGSGAASSFLQIEPRPGTPSEFPTVVRVLYDSVNIYIGAFCSDSLIQTHMTVPSIRRDFDATTSDLFGVVLDSFGDDKSCLTFQVNPLGALRDAEVFDNEMENADFDAVWSAETRVTADGWTAEIAIPWKSLRYPSNAKSFGINFFRIVRRANETSAWSPFPRSATPYRMEFAGRLGPIHPPAASGGVRLAPYLLSTNSPSGERGRYPVFKGGLNARWGLSSNTVLEAVVNADFAQADIDEQIINLNRYSIFLPERRPFFLENAGLYRVGPTDWIQPFYTRAVGLTSDGTPVPLEGGMRFTSYHHNDQVAGLMVRSGSSSSAPQNSFFLGRYLHSFGKSSHVGGMFSLSADQDTRETKNMVGVIDGYQRFSSEFTWQWFLSCSSLSMKAADSPARREEESGYSFASVLHLQNDDVNYFWYLTGVSPGYRTSKGFVAWPDLLANEFGVDLFLRPAWKPAAIRTFEPGLYFYLYQNASNLAWKEKQIVIWPLYIRFENSSVVSFKFIPTWGEVDETTDLLPGLSVQPGSYRYTRWEARVASDESKDLSGKITASTGGYYSGRLFSIIPTVTARLGYRASLALSLEHDQYEGDDEAVVRTNTVNSEIRVALAKTAHAAMVYQFDAAARQSRWLVRFSWEYAPLSHVYAILDTDRRVSQVPSLLLKCSHVFSF